MCVVKAFLTVAEGLTHLTSCNEGKNENQQRVAQCVQFQSVHVKQAQSR